MRPTKFVNGLMYFIIICWCKMHGESQRVFLDEKVFGRIDAPSTVQQKTVQNKNHFYTRLACFLSFWETYLVSFNVVLFTTD